MPGKKYKKAPYYFTIRIYVISSVLYFFLVFPVAGILQIQNLPDYFKANNLSLDNEGPVSDTVMSSDSLVNGQVADTTTDTRIVIGSGTQIIQENSEGEETVTAEANEMGQSFLLLVKLMIVSYIVGFIFNLPYKRYFRKKKKNKKISKKLAGFCKKYLLKTPLINTIILGLPYAITIGYMIYFLSFKEGIDEINQQFYLEFFFISLTSVILILLFAYFWLKHRVHIRYLEHLYTEHELRKRIFKLKVGKIRNRLWISAGMTTLLPLLIVAFYLTQSLTRIRDLKIGEFSEDHVTILLGKFADMNILNIDVGQLNGLFYVDIINSILMFGGIGTGIFIAFFYLLFFVRWTTEDIVYPVKELLTNMQKTGQGELENYAIVRTNDEIGRLTEEFNDMSGKLKSYIDSINLINQANSRFVPKQFLDFLQKENISDIKLGDQVQKDMTVLFSDIRDFTSISEAMTPKENFNFLNNYLGYMEPVIRNNNGFIDKFMGDAIMALFPDKAEDALNASIEMRIKLTEFNQIINQFGNPSINSGIGMHTGSLMLGVVGGEGRMDGTVISDAVNLTSRLEGLTKIYGSSVIITEDTLIRLGNPGAYNFRFLDIVRVKGKKEAVYIFELIDGEPDDLRNMKIKLKDDFGVAMNLYKKRSFNEALEKFLKVYSENPQDKASFIYIDRCKRYMKDGIPDDWDGAEAIDNKF